MIKFLMDYRTRSASPESFTAGQVVKDRSESSERHFVVRGVAAFLDKKGRLTDIEGRPVTDVEAPAPAPVAPPPPPVLPPELTDTLTRDDLVKIAADENVEYAEGVDAAAIREAIVAKRAEAPQA